LFPSHRECIPSFIGDNDRVDIADIVFKFYSILFSSLKVVGETGTRRNEKHSWDAGTRSLLSRFPHRFLSELRWNEAIDPRRSALNSLGRYAEKSLLVFFDRNRNNNPDP
jgi:hypothetical protein